MNLSSFIEDLASSQPTPGGGAAAAVVGAIAAALVEMVAGLTPGMVADNTLRKRLLKLADEDCRAFAAVMTAYRLPRDSEGRKEQVQKALQGATEVPWEVAQLAQQVARLARRLVAVGNRNAVSDAKSALHLAKAAKMAALENVKINLAAISDEEWKKKFSVVKLGGD